MATDLERFRDHCRRKAEEPYDGSNASAPCRGQVFGTRKPGPQHGWCASDACRCSCHEPTSAERGLWAQLADEIDAYLARDQVVDLFGQVVDVCADLRGGGR